MADTVDNSSGRPGADAPSGSQASPGAATASPPSVSISDAGGWIAWPGNGGGHGHPHDYSGGAIRYRCGQVDGTLTNCYNGWHSAEWRHDGADFDIVAYRAGQPA